MTLPRASDANRGISRRSFLETGVVATAGALVLHSSGVAATLQVRGQGADLARLSLAEAAELVRRKKVSPVELTEACLARIDALNPALNAYITVTAESALAQARDAEAEVQRGRWRGPLHGIPIGLKDLFDTAGVKTTAGSALFKDRVPSQDAEVVRRLKAAGAVLVGKQNMHEFAYGATSVVSHFGAVHNPWNVDYMAGGSSGGTAAAVAAELCYGALGSDTGGSIRGPAACCGVVGIKPTYGMVSTRGVIPLSWSRDHIGPLTRTVADAAIILEAIAGHDPEEAMSARFEATRYASTLRARPSSLRVGVCREFFFDDLHADVEAAIREALAVVGTLTAGARDATIPVSMNRSVTDGEAYTYHAESLAKTPELYQPFTRGRLRAAGEVTTVAYIEGRRELVQLRHDARKLFASVDVLVTPTAPIPARTIADAATDDPLKVPRPPDLRNLAPFNINGLPSMSIPCGFTRAGLPIGLQITGPPGGEAVVFQLAHAFEQATEWHTRRPPTVSGAAT